MFKHEVTSGAYFPIFRLNTGKYEPEITPYLDIFRAVQSIFLMFEARCSQSVVLANKNLFQEINNDMGKRTYNLKLMYIRAFF